jgi:ComF family protein
MEGIPLCAHCFSELHPRMETFKVGTFSARALYAYNEAVRSLLFQFKACGDIELGPVFLAYQAPLLRLFYPGYVLVPAPSYEAKNEARGFNHVEEMFKPLHLPVVKALRKTADVKQASLNFSERQKIGEHLAFAEGVSVAGKKILFVDDLITTGATAKACCALLKAHGAKKVKLLAMGHTKEKEGEAVAKT